MNDFESVKRGIDYAAVGGGWVSALAAWAEMVTPILTALFIALSTLWVCVRFYEYFKRGRLSKEDKV